MIVSFVQHHVVTEIGLFGMAARHCGFELVMRRYERASILLTSNSSVDD